MTTSTPIRVFGAVATWVGVVVILTLAVRGAVAELNPTESMTIAPDRELILVPAPKAKKPKPFQPIPCVTTPPLTGTPCPAPSRNP